MQSMQQSNWEEQLVRQTYERALKDQREFSRRDYATGGPLVAALSWSYVRLYAKAIENLMAQLCTDESLQETYKVAGAMFLLFGDLQPLDGEEVEEGETLGYLVLGRTVWASVTDAVMGAGDLDSSCLRSALVSQLATDLSNEYHRRYNEQMSLTYLKSEREKKEAGAEHNLENAINLRSLVKQTEKLVKDSGATLEFRRGRATDLFRELLQKEVPKRRGRKRNTVIEIPKPGEPWTELEAKLFAETCLDLLCVPKDEVPAENDWRPFQFKSRQDPDDLTKTPDFVVCRPVWEADMESVRQKLRTALVRFAPMCEQPQDWTYVDALPGCENRTGGFHTDKFKVSAPLVRTDGGPCATIPSAMAVDFLNRLQQVAWRLDQGQLTVIEKVMLEWHTDFNGIVRPRGYTWQELKEGTGLAALEPAVQQRDRLVNMAKPEKGQPGYDEYWDLSDFNKAQMRALYRDLEVRKRRMRSNTTAFARLLEMRDGKADDGWFFPWSFDSRTRAYPIAALLSPQGDAVNRYCLEFHKGERLNAVGERYALRSIGAAYQGTKGSIQSRVDWAMQNLEMVREIASGSNRGLELASEADEPLQLIQLCRAWVNHEAGEAWHTPVYFDATCSGWALAACLLGSDLGCQSTNVWSASETDAPRDLYQSTADLVIQWLSDPKEAGLKIPQKVCQELLIEMSRPGLWRACAKLVLVTAIYGSGPSTWSKDLTAGLHERGVLDTMISPKARGHLGPLLSKAANQLVGGVLAMNKALKEMAKQATWQAVDAALEDRYNDLSHVPEGRKRRKGPDHQKYLQICKEVQEQLLENTEGRGLGFTGADGSWISLTSYNDRLVRFSTLLHGDPSMRILQTDSPNIEKMWRQLAPAVIHNVDSTQLKHTINGLDPEIPVTVIHDCCGCLPNDAEMLLGRYRDATIKACQPDRFDVIAKDLGVENMVNTTGTGTWREHIANAVNLIN